MAPRRSKKPGEYEWARDSRRVQPLNHHTGIRLFDHKGKAHVIDATPEAVEKVLNDTEAPDEYRERIVRDLNSVGFLIPVTEVTPDE